MKLNGIFWVLVILILPATGFSTPTHQLNVGGYSSSGFSASALHSADGCYSNGYNMCGSETHGGITGTLDLTWDSNTSAYTSVLGNLTASDGTQVSITGGTLYSSLTNGSWGSLDTNYGTVNFDDLSGFYNGAANNYSSDEFFLWGQTSNMTTTITTSSYCTSWIFGTCARSQTIYTPTQTYSQNQWGLDLYGSVSTIGGEGNPDPVSVPEPASMGLMALGLMGVVAGRKRKLRLF